MKRKQLRFGHGFHVVLQNDRSQAATMVLKPGDSEGDPHNFHRGSDQWLLVLDGVGSATINGHRYPLKKGSLVLIERGDRHEIRATGTESLRTVSFYVPPAYKDDETPLPPGEPGG